MTSFIVKKLTEENPRGLFLIGGMCVVLNFFPGASAAEESPLSGAVLLKYCREGC